ncbi:uncharacterized protein LOC111387490 [Olea europaea var. sylvestris]|uniref:uncharacterized protein LOC111387490 n=1 Tax=Olea europaea var. sylvestris TaxID=158386 RepID=UPI000C1D525B|nr:uncharacterized protein LOC111387490 [Olea europaea var. sylvestris]
MSLSKTPPKTVTELLTRAEKYINMEEKLNPRKVGPSHDRVEHKRQHDPNPREEQHRKKQRQEVPPTPFTRLNTSKTNILMEIKDMKELKWPVRMRSPPESRDMNKYCEFHRDHGHTTENCKALQREIEALIKRGLLSSYVGNDKRPRNDRAREKDPKAKRDGQPTAGTINIIIGGIASGGDSNNGRKQYARRYALASGMPHGKLEDITFGTGDLEGISLPHALVISTVLANFEVKRILVDNGSAANILSQEAFAKMGISSQQLKAVKTPLQGFGGGVITPEGVVELPLTLGSGQKQITEMTSFQVVRVSMAYNAILGRPLLNKIKAIVSTFHLAMKFPTSNGVGVVRGDQIAVRQCYVASVREINNDVMQISRMDPEDGQQVKLAPVEELMEIELEHDKKVTIGRDLDVTLKTELVGCLSRNIDVFAWKVEDMSGIDPKIAVHRLNISPGARPVKQRKRQFAPERRERSNIPTGLPMLF